MSYWIPARACQASKESALVKVIARGSIVFCILCGVLPVATAQTATLTLGQTYANAGDMAEITVDLSYTGDGPATMVLFFTYDNTLVAPDEDAFEIDINDFEGNTITGSPVRVDVLAPYDEGILFSVQVHDGLQSGTEPALAVAISKVTDVFPQGALLTLAFEVDAAVVDDTEIDINGVFSGASTATFQSVLLEDPLTGNIVPFTSSAALQNASDLTLDFVDGLVTVGCERPPTPGGLTASTDQEAGVLLAWDEVTSTTVQYRVYRSTDSDVSNAIPLGEGWQDLTTFDDTTALPPQPVMVMGCPNGAKQPVTYYYWVKSRTLDGCESLFDATGVPGSRAAAAAKAGESVYAASALPGLPGKEAAGLFMIFALVIAVFACSGPLFQKR